MLRFSLFRPERKYSFILAKRLAYRKELYREQNMSSLPLYIELETLIFTLDIQSDSGLSPPRGVLRS